MFNGNNEETAALLCEVITPLLATLESLVVFSEKLNKANLLTKEEIKNVEGLIQKVYNSLETVTYRSGLQLRQGKYANHPLTLLWKRWNVCSEKVHQIANQFLLGEF